MRLLICAFALMMMASCGDDDPVMMEPDEPMVDIVEVTPDPGSVAVPSTTVEIVYHHFIKSNSDEDMNLLWSMNVEDSFPSQWIYFYCDSNLCYSETVKECPPSMPNVVTLDETKDWQLHVIPNGLAGTHTLTMEFYTLEDPDNILASYPIEITVDR